jgi:hypothetical protein
MKPQHLKRILFGSVIILVVGLIGLAGFWAQEHGYGSSSDGYTSISHGRLGDKIVFVLCSDTGGVGGRHNSSTTLTGFKYHGSDSASDGRRVDWQCETANGRSGTMTINNVKYDLGDGAMFLVTTRGEKTQVRQLRRDLSKFEPGRDSRDSATLTRSFKRLAQEDPGIAAFIAATKKPNRPLTNR